MLVRGVACKRELSITLSASRVFTDCARVTRAVADLDRDHVRLGGCVPSRACFAQYLAHYRAAFTGVGVLLEAGLLPSL